MILPGQREHIIDVMEEDAKFCQLHNLIDYSVFLIVVDVTKNIKSILKKSKTLKFDANKGEYKADEVEAEIEESRRIIAPSRDE